MKQEKRAVAQYLCRRSPSVWGHAMLSFFRKHPGRFPALVGTFMVSASLLVSAKNVTDDMADLACGAGAVHLEKNNSPDAENVRIKCKKQPLADKQAAVPMGEKNSGSPRSSCKHRKSAGERDAEFENCVLGEMAELDRRASPPKEVPVTAGCAALISKPGRKNDGPNAQVQHCEQLVREEQLKIEAQKSVSQTPMSYCQSISLEGKKRYKGLSDCLVEAETKLNPRRSSATSKPTELETLARPVR